MRKTNTSQEPTGGRSNHHKTLEELCREEQLKALNSASRPKKRRINTSPPPQQRNRTRKSNQPDRKQSTMPNWPKIAGGESCAGAGRWPTIDHCTIGGVIVEYEGDDEDDDVEKRTTKIQTNLRLKNVVFQWMSGS